MMRNCLILLAVLFFTTAQAAEVPLCLLPQASAASTNAGKDQNPVCSEILTAAKKVIEGSKSDLKLFNTTSIPAQLSVGAVYLQPITMSPAGMMLPREQSDIHLEMDIHAKSNLPSRGFAPGDWLPNVNVTYTIQKIGDKPSSTRELMPMVASDGAHYGDNVKLAGPGFYLVTFTAKTNPHFGWHTDTDSKILGTEFVDWQFTQTYLMKWTGVGKKGGY